MDLPGGDSDQLFESLRQLSKLPDETVLYPGHDYGGGSHQSLGETKQANPYLRIPTIETWRP